MDNYQSYPQSPITSRSYNQYQPLKSQNNARYNENQYSYNGNNKNNDSKIDTNSIHIDNQKGSVNTQYRNKNNESIHLNGVSSSNNNSGINSNSINSNHHGLNMDYFKTPKVKRQPDNLNERFMMGVKADDPTDEELLQKKIEELQLETTRLQAKLNESEKIIQQNNANTANLNTLRQQHQTLSDINSDIKKENDEFKKFINVQKEYINNLLLSNDELKRNNDQTSFIIQELNIQTRKQNDLNEQLNLQIEKCNKKISNYMEKNTKLDRELTDLRNELDSIKSRNEPASLYIPPQPMATNEFKLKMDELSLKLLESDKIIQMLQSENSKLKTNINQRQQQPVSQQTTQQRSINIQQVLRENEDLKKVLNDKQKETEELDKTLTDYIEKNQQLIQEVEILNNSLVEQESQYMEYKQNYVSEQRSRRSFEEEVVDESKKTVIDIAHELNATRQLLKRIDQLFGLVNPSSGSVNRSMYSSSSNLAASSAATQSTNKNDLVSSLHAIYNDIINIKYNINKQYSFFNSNAINN